MFDQLTERFSKIFAHWSGRGVIRAEDLDEVSRDIRLALLEADVALPVIKQILADVRDKAVGQEVLKSLRPDQIITKLVHEALLQSLGAAAELNLKAQAPVVILMTGLQGSGKTTTAAKLAKYLKEKLNKKALLASADIYRPAAQEQLQVNAQRVGAAFMPIQPKEQPVAIAKRALQEAKKGGFDALIFDTAGRLELDVDLMAELQDLHTLLQPTETLFVADSLMGQAAAQVAKGFHDAVGVTGIVLTRIDGDSRGGAALSIRAVTGQPIKFLGAGEGLETLSPFDPERIAKRILGMGDVVELVEKVQAAVSQEEAEAAQAAMMKGQFDLNMLKQQLQMMTKLGSMSSLLGLVPGMSGLKDKLDMSKLDDGKLIKRQIALINSMTAAERANPSLLNARRRVRIAQGAGQQVQDVNKLIKSFEQMQQMMKMFKDPKKAGMLQKLMGR